MNAKGTVHKFGDNVDTDVIIPAHRYIPDSLRESEFSKHCRSVRENSKYRGNSMFGGWDAALVNQDYVFGVVDNLMTKYPDIAFFKWDCLKW